MTEEIIKFEDLTEEEKKALADSFEDEEKK